MIGQQETGQDTAVKGIALSSHCFRKPNESLSVLNASEVSCSCKMPSHPWFTKTYTCTRQMEQAMTKRNHCCLDVAKPRRVHANSHSMSTATCDVPGLFSCKWRGIFAVEYSVTCRRWCREAEQQDLKGGKCMGPKIIYIHTTLHITGLQHIICNQFSYD